MIPTGLKPDAESLKIYRNYYPEKEATYAALEVAYFRQFNELPEWGYFVEQVIESEDGYIFVHADTKAMDG